MEREYASRRGCDRKLDHVTEALFQRDAYLRSCTARVVEVLPNGVVLDRTVFYPLGGGQPGDTGRLRSRDGRQWRVVDTRKGDAGRVLHQLEAGIAPPATGDEVEALLDWERRYAQCACTAVCTCSDRSCAMA